MLPRDRAIVVLCDRCSLAAPEGTGWWTPSVADRAALDAGWEMTPTEHLCPACASAKLDEAEGGDQHLSSLPVTAEPVSQPDVCWPLNELRLQAREQAERGRATWN